MSKIILDENAVAPATPAAGKSIIYPKADGLWYTKDDAGVETPVAGAGGTGTVTHTVGALTVNRLVVGNTAADVDVLASLGTTVTVLHGNAGGRPSFGAVDLAADVTGALPQASVTNLVADLALKAALASPALSGTPTAPTAAIGTNTTQLATTAFVKAAKQTVVALVDGATPALDASLGTLFTLAAAGNRTIAVPTNPSDGQRIIIRHLASGGARTLALNAGAGGFRFGSDITALTATASGKIDYIGCVYNQTDSFWDVVAVTKGF